MVHMPYLSPSRMSLFYQCELAFKLKYLEVSPFSDKTTDYYAAYGTLMHDILEEIAKGIHKSSFEAEKKYNENFGKCGIPVMITPDYYKAGLVALRAKFEEIRSLNILGIETEFNVPISFSIPPLHGFIDLIYQDEIGIVLRDYKTSKPFTNAILKKQLQPFVYSIAAKHIFGELPYKFEFDFVRFGEIKSIIIDETHLKMAEIKINAFWNKLNNSTFPASYNPFFCENFCEKKSLCPTYLLKVNS